MEQNVLLSMSHITKIFTGNRVLQDVSFTLEAGTIHALIGENGAGKSTLMKILGGVYFQEEGEICIEGCRQQFTKAKDALTAGVGIIYQEFNLVPTLSIAENIYLGKELHTSRGVLNRKQMVKAANEFMEQLGFEMVDCSRSVSALSVAQQQMVEIAKALFNRSRILVLDEPTAVLTEKESRKLFTMIHRLKEQGVGIIYISHRLEEVLELSDKITVLRDGKYIETLDNGRHQVEKEELVRLMVGRSLEQYYPDKSYTPEEKERDWFKFTIYFKPTVFELEQNRLLDTYMGMDKNDYHLTICDNPAFFTPDKNIVIELPNFSSNVFCQYYIRDNIILLTDDKLVWNGITYRRSRFNSLTEKQQNIDSLKPWPSKYDEFDVVH